MDFERNIREGACCGMKHCQPPIYGPDITEENWEQRRVQIVRLFEKNVFGRTPRDGFETRADLLYAAEALEGTAKREFYRRPDGDLYGYI